MDLGTIIGVLATAGLIIGSIVSGSSLMTFVNAPSLMIVVGGTVTVAMINFPLPRVFSAIKVALMTVKHQKQDIAGQNQRILDLANTARKEGILALEKELSEVSDPLMKKGLQLLVDGIDPELIETMLYDELDAIGDRHKQGAKFFQSLAAISPALGMIGTLIGLVQMLQNMSDPSAIGPAMAVALLTTLYGALLANIVCMPIAGKLEDRHFEEKLAKTSIIKGLLGIATGVNPRILGQHLEGDLPPAQRAEAKAA